VTAGPPAAPTGGAYVLIVDLPRPLALDSPRFRGAVLPAGRYAYCGSAYGPGGLAARIARHRRRDKRQRWHIDRLTVNAHDMAALAVPDGDECRLVEALLATRRFAVAVPGFGSSDCSKCEGHLLAAN